MDVHVVIPLSDLAPKPRPAGPIGRALSAVLGVVALLGGIGLLAWFCYALMAASLS